jgi:hypothetical protein
MSQGWDNAENRPSAEELMAFTDGELPPPRSAQVAAWVRTHPDAAADVEEQQRLRAVWEQTTAPEPSPVSWERTLRRVEAALPVRRPAGWRRFRGLWLSGALAAGVAVVVLGRSLLMPPAPPPGGPVEEEPFPVAEAREIDILGMDVHDADSLVGHPPVLADLRFVAAGDLGEVRVDPHPDGWGARLEPGEVPMVVAQPARKNGGR